MKKFLTFLLCLCLLLSAVACTSDTNTPDSESDAFTETAEDSAEDSTEDSAKDTAESLKALYKDVIADYIDLLTAKKNGEALSAPNTKKMNEREAAIAEALYGIADACTDAENMGYGYKDMDGNGCPELLLMNNYGSIKAVFTISNKKPLLLEAAYGSNNYIMFAPNNRFFIRRETVEGNLEETTFYTARVEGNKMVYDLVYGGIYDQNEKKVLNYYQTVNGIQKTITSEEFNELDREYRRAYGGTNPTTAKLSAPRIHLPLKETASDNNLPVADFSSYEAIRKTYKAIAACPDDFKDYEWISGEYDNRFAFPDDAAYDVYNRLLYLSKYVGENLGYDEIDLNGDGQDELLLLTEYYGIKAIFTQKNGIPVMVEVLSNETAWLDDNGQIHVDNEEYYELEYLLYEFKENGDYNLIYSILVAENGNRYLTKNGKTEILSFEDSLDLYYDDYCCYTEPFDSGEHTRNVSSLTYTPLTQPKDDPTKLAISQTWKKYADLEKTSGEKWGAWSNTYITFENVTDTEMDVHFKYRYTVLYPDPDKDNYLLDKDTDTYFDVTATNQNGTWRFEGDGIKGHFEFSQNYLWLVIEESGDQRFPTGFHCYSVYTPEE